MWRDSCLGGMIVGREAARRMVPRGRGSILFTGGRTSRRADAGQAAFAVGKFGFDRAPVKRVAIARHAILKRLFITLGVGLGLDASH